MFTDSGVRFFSVTPVLAGSFWPDAGTRDQKLRLSYRIRKMACYLDGVTPYPIIARRRGTVLSGAPSSFRDP